MFSHYFPLPMYIHNCKLTLKGKSMDKKMRCYRLESQIDKKLARYGIGNKSQGIRNLIFLVEHYIGKREALSFVKKEGKK